MKADDFSDFFLCTDLPMFSFFYIFYLPTDLTSIFGLVSSSAAIIVSSKNIVSYLFFLEGCKWSKAIPLHPCTSDIKCENDGKLRIFNKIAYNALQATVLYQINDPDTNFIWDILFYSRKKYFRVFIKIPYVNKTNLASLDHLDASHCLPEMWYRSNPFKASL